jgi:hypothetical protein
LRPSRATALSVRIHADRPLASYADLLAMAIVIDDEWRTHDSCRAWTR